MLLQSDEIMLHSCLLFSQSLPEVFHPLICGLGHNCNHCIQSAKNKYFFMLRTFTVQKGMLNYVTFCVEAKEQGIMSRRSFLRTWHFSWLQIGFQCITPLLSEWYFIFCIWTYFLRIASYIHSLLILYVYFILFTIAGWTFLFCIIYSSEDVCIFEVCCDVKIVYLKWVVDLHSIYTDQISEVYSCFYYWCCILT